MTDVHHIPPVVDVVQQIRQLECDRNVLTNIILMLTTRMNVRELRFPIEEVAAIGNGYTILIDQEGTTTVVRLSHKSEHH